jgi:thiosulfate dehydrogenase [quinone] large subunit
MSNPLQDLFAFLQKSTVHGRFPIYVLIFLLIASIVVALFNFVRDSEQRTFQNVYLWLARFFVGGMWYQQMLWKMPPTFTDQPDGSGGLGYWMGEMVKYAAFRSHASLVNDLMLPNFKLFAYQVWAGETFIAVSLLLGLFTRLGGLLGTLMAINLWFGLYNRPNEWPWTYFFLILLNGFFLVFRAGRALGIDTLLAPRTVPAGRFFKRLLWWIS